MARKKQFKAESQRLLDLMINSIYTNKEIFLRELISNASDAEDKLYFKSLKDTSMDVDRDALDIEIELDRDARTLTIRDKGIGMSEKELETYLGTIAKSDSHAFKEALDRGDDTVDVIGQFGVGFYSAFMVSKHVEVISRQFGSEDAYRFSSNGLDGFTIEPAERMYHGTTIVCHLKDNTDETFYDTYLDPFQIEQLVKTYSDYIRYPIRLVGEEETKILNSMVPIWKRSKSDVTTEELNEFYKDKFHDFEEPAHTIQMKIEGTPSFDALIFIPKHVPMDFYSQNFEPGLQLYSRGVYIMEHNTALVPEEFRFVRGLVDSPDLSLNISREILQHDHQIKVIAKKIERKIKSELERLMKNEREEYEAFWKNFGMSLKYGIYTSYGAKKESLQDLLLFKNSKNDNLITLAEYVADMKEDQREIYFVSGKNVHQCASLPQTEFVLSKGFDILYLLDEIDEFTLQVMGTYGEYPFKSVNQGDLNLLDEATQEEIKEKKETYKSLLDRLKDALSGQVDDVTLSTRLVHHPVCLSSEEGISFEMEKVLSAMPDAHDGFKAKRILEINPDHELLVALELLFEKDPESVESYAQVLYDQACLIEGLPVADPVEFSKKISELMIRAIELTKHVH